LSVVMPWLYRTRSSPSAGMRAGAVPLFSGYPTPKVYGTSTPKSGSVVEYGNVVSTWPWELTATPRGNSLTPSETAVDAARTTAEVAAPLELKPTRRTYGVLPAERAVARR